MVLGASSPAAFRLGLKTPRFLGLPLLLEHHIPLRSLLDEVGGYRGSDTSPALGPTLVQQLGRFPRGRRARLAVRLLDRSYTSNQLLVPSKRRTGQRIDSGKDLSNLT